jgi:hypothetical protein
MKNMGNALFEAIGNIDDSIIEHAHQPAKKNIWIKITAAAAILAVGCGIFSFVHQKQYVYAEQLDTGAFSMNAPERKVECASELSAYADGTIFRVMILIYNQEEAYPELFNTITDGYEMTNNQFWALYDTDALMNGQEELDFSAYDQYFEWTTALKEQVMEQECAWLESIGAQDLYIPKHTSSLLFATIKKEQLSQLNDGKCNYRVFLAPKSIPEWLDADFSGYYGVYECDQCIYVPLISSDAVTDEAAALYRLTIGAEQFVLDGGAVSIRIDQPRYVLDSADQDEDRFYGLIQDGLLEAEINQAGDDMLKLLENEKSIISVYGGDTTYTIYIVQDDLYLDLGTRGIYHFTKGV